MSKRKHIFLSYQSLERAFALKLAAELRNTGVAVWVDCLPEGIRPGDDWAQSLEEALNTCRALIAVVSPDYVGSKVCRRELHRADQLARPIFPLLLKAVAAEQWPLEIERLQYIDVTDWQDESAFKTAFDQFLARLKAETIEAVGQRPDPEQQYLISLIAELEGRGGVSDYVTLVAELTSRDNPDRAVAPITAKWGLDAEFALLETSAPNPMTPGTRGAQSKKMDDVLSLIEEPRRFVLLGEPGAGKTTTLRRLALEAARARLADGRAKPLPLLLRLPHWLSEPDALSFVKAHWPFESDPGPALASGDVILFLDGLNEMGGQGVEKAQILKRWFASPQRPLRLAVTCRADDYEPEIELGIDQVTIRPMDDKRVRRFAKAYLQDDAPKFLKDTLPKGQTAEDPLSLLALARNPYLLTCLMLLYQSAPEKRLPRNTGALFDRLVGYLWNREQMRDTRGWMRFEEAGQRFAALAAWMVEQNQATNLPRRTVIDRLGGEDLLNAGVGTNILDAVGDQVGFYHQLIEEYFAAVDLQKNPSETRLAAFLDNFRVDMNARYLKQEWWPLGHTRKNVLMCLAGLVDDADALLVLLLERDPDLAADCAISGITLRSDTIQRIAGRLREMQRYWIDQAVSYGLSSYDGEAEHLQAIYGSEDNARYFERKLEQFSRWAKGK